MKDQQSWTVHLLLNLIDDEKKRLHQTLSYYGAIFNEYSQWFVENKTTHTTKAHHALYSHQKEEYSEVPTALIQAARNRAASCVTSFNTRNKKNKYSIVPHFRAHSMSYAKTAVALNTKGILTFSLAHGKRAKTQITIPRFFTDRYGDWLFQSAYIGINTGGRPFANLVFCNNTPDKKNRGLIVGVDRGVYNTVATSVGGGEK